MSRPGSCTENTKSTRLNPATSEGFDKRLVAYAAVAGARLLALAPSTVAGVIYNPTTFTNDYPYPPSSAFFVDLNGDARNDFVFGTLAGYSFRNFLGYGIGGAQLLGVGAGWDALFVPGNNIIGPGNSPWTASAAHLGAPRDIGPTTLEPALGWAGTRANSPTREKVILASEFRPVNLTLTTTVGCASMSRSTRGARAYRF